MRYFCHTTINTKIIMKKLSFLVLGLLFFSCSSDDSNDTPDNSSNTVAFFKANLTNLSVNYIQDNSNSPSHFNQPIVGYSGNGSNKSFYYSSSMEPLSLNNYPSLDITLHHMYQSTDESTETTSFNTIFSNKPTNFITSDQDFNWTKGVSVTYTDNNGDSYSTLSGSQTGSTINYTSTVAGTNSLTGLQTQTVSGTVACKLYKDSDPSIIINLTAGSFKLVFQEYD